MKYGLYTPFLRNEHDATMKTAQFSLYKTYNILIYNILHIRTNLRISNSKLERIILNLHSQTDFIFTNQK